MTEYSPELVQSTPEKESQVNPKFKAVKSPSEGSFLYRYFNYLVERFSEGDFSKGAAIKTFERHTCYAGAVNKFSSLLVAGCITEVKEGD